MDEEPQAQANGNASPGEPDQVFELYIKASAIDRASRGSCPVCHQWFMIAYLLAERQKGVNFKVFTVSPDAPPKFMIDNGWSRKFPVVRAVNCRDKAGNDMSDLMYDTFEELESFFDSINNGQKELKRNNQPNAEAMKVIEDLYNSFNHFMNGKPETNLVKNLKQVNEFMEEKGKRFLLEDGQMCFSDCYLLPRLQHVRVAGKAYREFEIPKEFSYIWRYLHYAYQTKAFTATMPSDEEIVVHYENKFPSVAQKLKRGWKPKESEGFHYTTTIPEGYLQEPPANDEDED